MLDRNPGTGIELEVETAPAETSRADGSTAAASRRKPAARAAAPLPPPTAERPTVEPPEIAPGAPLKRPASPPASPPVPVKSRRRRLLPVAAALVIAGGAAAGGYWWWNQQQVPAGILTLYGDVDIREADLAFDASERITAINVEEGDRVTRGEVLATLDTRHIDAQLAAAQAAVASQQAALDKLIAGNRPEEIAEARANLDAARSDAELAAAEDRRIMAIAASAGGAAAVSQSDLDTAKSSLDVANAKVDVAQKALDLEVAGARTEDIAAARAAVREAEAQLNLLQQEANDAQLVAPEAGIVLSRLAEPGEMASPARAILSLAIVTPKWVRAYVSEPDLGKLHQGMSARITIDGFPDKPLTGWIGFISPVAEFTPKSVETSELRSSLVYEVRVFANDPDNRLRLGMPATVELATDATTGQGSGK
jgi:membrane fusion protein PltH